MINQRAVEVNTSTKTHLFKIATFENRRDSNLAFRIVGPIGKLLRYDQLEKESARKALEKFGIWIYDSILDEEKLDEIFKKSYSHTINVSNLQLPPPTIALSTFLRILEQCYEETYSENNIREKSSTD